MANLTGTQTVKNLMIAFTGESMAVNRYTYYAKVAKKEGYEQLSAIFLETAEHEKSHAKTFYRFLKGRPVELNTRFPETILGSTTENLKAAISGENEEWTNIYPVFEKIAWEEGFKTIATKFKLIAKIEKFHEERFTRLLENIDAGLMFKKEKKVKWMCRKCGFIHESERALKNCPTCEHPQAYFEILAENY